MNIKLNKGILTTLLSKLIVKLVKDNLQCKADVNIENLDLEYKGGDTTVKLSIEAHLNSDEFNKLIQMVKLD